LNRIRAIGKAGLTRRGHDRAMEIVNGYGCRDCGDVAKARRGVDPAGDDAAARIAGRRAARERAEAASATRDAAAAPAESAPLAEGPRGRTVNLEA
jgi:hypothetical protein